MARSTALQTGKGETFTLNIGYTDAQNNPVNLGGYSAEFAVFNRSASLSPIGTYPAAVDEAGNIKVKIDADETSEWDTGIYGYRLTLTDPDGDKSWVLHGRLTITAGVGA